MKHTSASKKKRICKKVHKREGCASRSEVLFGPPVACAFAFASTVICCVCLSRSTTPPLIMRTIMRNPHISLSCCRPVRRGTRVSKEEKKMAQSSPLLRFLLFPPLLDMFHRPREYAGIRRDSADTAHQAKTWLWYHCVL